MIPWLVPRRTPLTDDEQALVERVARALGADWSRRRSDMKPSIGRIVHARIGGQDGAPVWRPAMVTDAFGELANVTIFLDGHNDDPARIELHQSIERIDPVTARGYSRPMGTASGCWRWPPRE